MSHEIEADFKEDYHDEEKQCWNCTSFEIKDGLGYCREAGSEIPLTGHCDFFQSKD